MSDLTSLFKATVKTVKIKESSSIDKSILTKNKKSEFSLSSKNVVVLISKLKDFLLANRKQYLNDASLFGMFGEQMKENDKEKLDIESEVFIKQAKMAIKQLEIQADSKAVSLQQREHMTSMLSLIKKYLIDVCEIYSSQRAIRIKRTIDHKRLSKLEPDMIMNKISSQEKGKGVESGDAEKTNLIEHFPEKRGIKTSEKSKSNSSSSSSVSNVNSPNNSGVGGGVGGKELSDEEMMMLQLENEEIYNEMSGLVDQLKQVEGKVVEISQLQQIFTEKVLEQEKTIEKVAESVEGTSENIQGANEEIRQAMKNNAGFRVWVLFFLLVCTFSLLFLDWYNA